MKKGKILYFINWILVFSIPVILATTTIKTDEIAANVDVKKLKTNLFLKESTITKKIVVENNDTNIEKNDDVDVSKPSEREMPKEKPKEEQEEKVLEVVKEENTEPVKTDDKNNALIGKLSYYRANCNGCSGVTASGYDVSGGNLYYHDTTYGDVRIIAAGSEIKLYSIVKIKNSSLGNEVLSIVLDRGGNIGQGRKFLIDILTNDKESKGGVESNISLEILRDGR